MSAPAPTSTPSPTKSQAVPATPTRSPSGSALCPGAPLKRKPEDSELEGESPPQVRRLSDTVLARLEAAAADDDAGVVVDGAAADQVMEPAVAAAESKEEAEAEPTAEKKAKWLTENPRPCICDSDICARLVCVEWKQRRAIAFRFFEDTDEAESKAERRRREPQTVEQTETVRQFREGLTTDASSSIVFKDGSAPSTAKWMNQIEDIMAVLREYDAMKRASKEEAEAEAEHRRVLQESVKDQVGTRVFTYDDKGRALAINVYPDEEDTVDGVTTLRSERDWLIHLAESRANASITAAAPAASSDAMITEDAPAAVAEEKKEESE